ncbi:MAG: hypothetical protein GWO19_26070 [Nitrospinaceae bacterium]|nr:hypothetical protein [Nitrospinaceae bacterium]NIU97251.1 hypothetical protein [Nitrospinaceae bacterium]
MYGKGYSHHEPGYSHEEWEYRYNSGTAYRTPAPPAYYGAGVASPDYGYRRDPVSEGLIGGALGAATGAAIGAVVGDPGDGAAIGAAIGGINGISRGLLGRGLLW